MSFFTASPFLKVLGWALLNSIWQFMLLCLVYWFITTLFKRMTAMAKHAIAVYLLFAGCIYFLFILIWKFISIQSAGSVADAFILRDSFFYSVWHTANSLADVVIPYCAVMYICWILALFIKFSVFVKYSQALPAKETQKMSASWRTYVKTVADQLGIEKPVKILLSMQVDTPQVLGFIKPVILMPFACLSQLTTAQLEAILLHELVHIKRNDYLINLFVAFSEIVFFFNPFVSLLVNAIRKEREYSCDDMVMQFQFQPRQYAAALLTLEKNRRMPVTFGIAVSGKNTKQLLARIERIAGVNRKQPIRPSFKACLAAVIALLLIATMNPVKMVTSKNGVPAVSVAVVNSKFQTNSNYSISGTGKIKTQTAIQHKKNTRSKTISANCEDLPINSNDEGWSTVVTAGDGSAGDEPQTAASSSPIDYALPEGETAVAPAPELATVTPYVPANSFSYHIIQDTTVPKTKGETYQELLAREALIKAKKAMNVINWQKIEKQMKYSARDLAKLKSEITRELVNLNWQQINKDVQTEMQGEHIQKAVQAIRQENLLKLYQQYETNSELINKQLLESDQLLKASDKKMQSTRQQLLQKQKQAQEELKKQRIIYI